MCVIKYIIISKINNHTKNCQTLQYLSLYMKLSVEHIKFMGHDHISPYISPTYIWQQGNLPTGTFNNRVFFCALPYYLISYYCVMNIYVELVQENHPCCLKTGKTLMFITSNFSFYFQTHHAKLQTVNLK